MAGHIPKFGDANHGNYSEVFGAPTRLIGRNGSGDVAKGLNNQGGNSRGGAPAGRGDLPGQEKDASADSRMRRGGPGSSEGSGNLRSAGGSGSYEKEVPPRRQGSGGKQGSSEREGQGLRKSQDNILGSGRPRQVVGRGAPGRINDSSSKGGRTPRRDDDYAGAGHLPKFGDWDDNAGDSNYTMMFQAAAEDRRGVPASHSRPEGEQRGGHYKPNNSKKTASSCWCFGA
uniref:RIN4 pathogenic type III effector avirulence factor Avr cleavage site domain-containing protein n=1 Tax=Physcomitrium patens TaxID=3218 RepID=A0A2K1J0H7_PHYPA|nr:uncharacterized protein LOC112295206 [Physcomitrium patens]PNR35032.1 hypothetical protein PHYPA_022931 [Physcomitrium patens]|eukprot:XP_024402260.1 uncharacterized protein LOC112295206 [Physcomitrella patens]